MTTDPTPEAPVAPPPPATFRWDACIGGLVLALFLGGIGNIVVGLIDSSIKTTVLALLIGAIPGAFFVLVSLLARRNGFKEGLLIGGCIIAVIGGACGVSMMSMSFH